MIVKYNTDKGTLYHGDCIETMQSFPDKSVNMVLCDLPYGLTQNEWDEIIPFDKLWEQYERIITNDGVIVLTSQGLFTAKLMLSNPKMFKYKMVWIKSKATNFLNAKKQPLRQHEDVLVFYKKQCKYFPVKSQGEPYVKHRSDRQTGSYGNFNAGRIGVSDGERYPTDVFYSVTATDENVEQFHSTQKPVSIGRYLIRMFTQEGDVVLDNAFGSGSFLIAAALENRKFIGIEKNDIQVQFKTKEVNIFDKVISRIENMESEKTKRRNLIPKIPHVNNIIYDHE